MTRACGTALTDREGALRESLSIQLDLLHEGYTAIAEANRLLGQYLAEQSRYDEAEELLLDSHAALETGPQTLRLQRRSDRTIQSIVALYEAWGKSQDLQGVVAERHGVSPSGNNTPRRIRTCNVRFRSQGVEA